VAITATVQYLEILITCGGKNPERGGERMEATRQFQNSIRRIWRNGDHDLVNTSFRQQFIQRRELVYRFSAVITLNKARSALIKYSDQTRPGALSDECCGQPLANFARPDDSDLFREAAALSQPLYGRCCKQAKPA